MTQIITRRPWTRQPQTGFGCSPALQFSRAIVPSSGLRDLLGTSTYTFGGAATFGGAPKGRVVSFNGTNNNIIALTADESFIVGTHVFECYVNAYGSSGGVLYNSSNEQNLFAFQVRVGSSGQLVFIRKNSAQVATSSAGVIQIGRLCRIAVSLDANGTGKHIGAVNGVVVVNTSASSTYVTGTSPAIGDQQETGGNVPFNGLISLWAYSPIAYGAAVLQSLSLNPWGALFAPKPQQIWVPSAAAGAAPTISDLKTASLTYQSVQATYDYTF